MRPLPARDGIIERPPRNPSRMALQLNSDTVGDGPPLLVLHGLFGSAGNWRSVARTLSATHRVSCLDLRNHGASPWAATMSYAEMADDVAHFIERQPTPRASVLGHSMGGKTAMALALTRPDLVDRLLVVDIAPLDYADTLSALAETMRGVDLSSATSRGEVQRTLASRLPDPSVAAFLAQNLVARDGHFDWRINLAALSPAMAELAGFPASLRERRFESPLHAIAGEHSSYVPRHDAAAFAPMFPQAVVEVVAGAGHWVHADRPREFVAAVQRALGSGG